MNLTLANVLGQVGLPAPAGADQVEVHQAPKPHQLRNLKNALTSDNYRWLLADDPGTGKSLPSFLFTTYYWLEGNRVVAVMPPVLCTQYVEEFQAKLSFQGRAPVLHHLQEGPAERARLFAEWEAQGTWPDVLVMSYALFLMVWKTLNPQYDVLIADEGHALKSHTGKTHQAARDFLGTPMQKAFLDMTGTVMPTDIGCAYGTIALVSPGYYRDRRAFEAAHAVKITDDKGHAQIVGWKNFDKLSQALFLRGSRVTIDQVLPLDRPTIIEQVVEMAPAHRALYRKLLTERLLEFEDGRVIDASQAQALRQHALRLVTNPEAYTDRPIENRPREWLSQVFDMVNVWEEKIIVFCWFQETVQRLATHFERFNPALIYGGAGSNEKQKRKFLDDPTCRMLFTNPESGGVGLNLQAVCCLEVFYESFSSPKHFEQGIGRVYRGGQTRPVRVYLQRVKGTLYGRRIDTMLKRVEARRDVLLDRTTLLDELLGGEA